MTSFLDRLLGRAEPPKTPYKAVTNVYPWSDGPALASLRDTPQRKAEACLRAYKVGWFHKGGKKIADSISGLDWALSDGDAESDTPAEVELDRPDLDIPFDALQPIDQLQRLLERPNAYQTGRQLFQKTQIRLDFAGTAFWYLEGATGGLPTAIYGISPARMWPAYAKDGRLIGWVMDKDAPSGGTPFDASEILVFSTGNADSDSDPFGVSIVEAVYAEVPLTDLMARHTGDVLTTGGRLAGMLWPKDRALTEDEFSDAQRAWRNVTSGGDAARRLLLFPEPMEYASGASTPAEIGIPELAALNRDNILTAFPISPYQLGVPMPGGLNSGELRREDRRDYWEGTIAPRVALLKEVIQTGLVSRYEEATGQTFDFDLPIPNLDDASALAEKAKAYKDLVGIGLDPKEALQAVGLAHIRWLGLPELLDPAKQAEAQRKQQEAATARLEQINAQQPLGKAVKASREDDERYAIAILSDFFDGQRERVTSELRRLMPVGKRAKTLPDGWWNGKVEDEALEAAMRAVYLRIGKSSLQVVADQLDRIVMPAQVKRILGDLLTNGATRITDINSRTRDAIAGELAEGIRRGYSINQLIDGVPAEEYKGLTGSALDNGVAVWSDARAETIARTETALSANRASLRSYGDFGIAEVDAIDGDEDPECAERNGQRFGLEEALDIEDHPNGTLDWIPVIPEKSARLPEPVVVNITNQAPDIHVTTPDINVTTPDVHVNLPEFHFPEPAVKARQEDDVASINQTFIIGDREAIKALEPQPTPIVNVETQDLTPVLEAIKAVAERETPAPVVHVKTADELRITAMPDRVTKRNVKREKGVIVETTEVETDG